MSAPDFARELERRLAELRRELSACEYAAVVDAACDIVGREFAALFVAATLAPEDPGSVIVPTARIDRRERLRYAGRLLSGVDDVAWLLWALATKGWPHGFRESVLARLDALEDGKAA